MDLVPDAAGATLPVVSVWLCSTAQTSRGSAGNGRSADDTGNRRYGPTSWPTANHSWSQRAGRWGSEGLVSAAAEGQELRG